MDSVEKRTFHQVQNKTTTTTRRRNSNQNKTRRRPTTHRKMLPTLMMLLGCQRTNFYTKFIQFLLCLNCVLFDFAIAAGGRGGMIATKGGNLGTRQKKYNKADDTGSLSVILVVILPVAQMFFLLTIIILLRICYRRLCLSRSRKRRVVKSLSSTLEQKKKNAMSFPNSQERKSDFWSQSDGLKEYSGGENFVLNVINRTQPTVLDTPPSEHEASNFYTRRESRPSSKPHPLPLSPASMHFNEQTKNVVQHSGSSSSYRLATNIPLSSSPPSLASSLASQQLQQQQHQQQRQPQQASPSPSITLENIEIVDFRPSSSSHSSGVLFPYTTQFQQESKFYNKPIQNNHTPHDVSTQNCARQQSSNRSGSIHKKNGNSRHHYQPHPSSSSFKTTY